MKKCPKPCTTNKNKEKWTKYTSLTLLNQRKLALIARNTLFALQNNWSNKKFKMSPPLFRPTANHTCQQKQNPSRETFPLMHQLDVCVYVPTALDRIEQ